MTLELLQKHLSYENIEPEYQTRKDTLTLKDGVELSVQAGSGYLYSTPRCNLLDGNYCDVEVGFPSISPPESWKEYCDDLDKPTDTVYAYIPICMVLDFINDHGGLRCD